MIRASFLAAAAVCLLGALAQPAAAQDPRSCVALDALAQRLNARGGTQMVQEIRGIFVEAGLAFGGTRTSAKCSSALRALRVVERRIANGGASGGGSRDTGIREGFEREALRFASTTRWGPGFGGDKVTYWTHNGSRMAYESGPGTARRIWYWEPRSGLRGIGIRKGVLLFDGALSRGTIRGTARIFKSGCGAYLYEVGGQASADGRRVVMTGRVSRDRATPRRADLRSGRARAAGCRRLGPADPGRSGPRRRRSRAADRGLVGGLAHAQPARR